MIFRPVIYTFQFTTSQGGRPSPCISNLLVFVFQFTTSQGGRHPALCDGLAVGVFQFTTSQGGRHCPAHSGCYTIILSIHDLTRRSTAMTAYIHCITSFQFTTSQGGRRLRLPSEYCPVMSFNSRPHKEVDTAIVLYRHIPLSFNSRPHKEVDGADDTAPNNHASFNSRPHKEVDSPLLLHLRRVFLFQFTTSQGGRPLPSSLIPHCCSTFNSRPHKEVDSVRELYEAQIENFQFTTSQGGRQQIHTIFAQKITNILFIFHKVLTQFYILLNIFPLLYHLSSPFPVRISRSFSVHFTSALEDQSFRHIKTRFYPYVFHFTFVFVTQIIKSQAICLFINDIL